MTGWRRGSAFPAHTWTGPIALAVMIVAYVAVFGTLTWRQQANYGTFGFDMGIYDQGVWLLANGETPFVTVRGLHLFGHHMNPILFAFVPIYWLGGGAGHLYLVETIALAIGAVPVFLLARRAAAGRDWVGCAVALAYLLHPTIEWINWWHFHPDALAIAPLLWAWWFATCGRWRWFAAMVVLALLAKEDVGLAVTMMGVSLALESLRHEGSFTENRRRVRVAATACVAAGAMWFAIATQVVIPHYLGGDPFYAQQFFADYGDSTGSVIVGMVTSPGEVVSTLAEESRQTYYMKLIGPLGLLPIAGPVALLIAGPQMAVNTLSSLAGTHDFRFHYSSIVLVALMIATTETIGVLFRWRPRAGTLAVAWLVVAAIVANAQWSPSPLGREFDTGIWAKPIPRHEVFARAIDLIPDDATVTASYYLIPHLTHRPHAYEWPNPWIPSYYGLFGENAPDPATIDYVLLDRTLNQEPMLADSLLEPGGDYEVVVDEDSVLLARRVRN